MAVICKNKGDNIYEKLYSSLCKKSMEAAKTYCKAFGAEITLEMKNDSGTAYENKYCATVIDKYGVCWWIAI